MMTVEEIELSKKLLNEQAKVIEMKADQDKLFLALAAVIRRLRVLETVVEGMAIGKGR